jgi:hypothetical protein
MSTFVFNGYIEEIQDFTDYLLTLTNTPDYTVSVGTTTTLYYGATATINVPLLTSLTSNYIESLGNTVGDSTQKTPSTATKVFLDTVPVEIDQCTAGTFTLNVKSLQRLNQTSAVYCTSKNTNAILPAIVRLNGTNTRSSTKMLMNWNQYCPLEMYKNNTNANGTIDVHTSGNSNDCYTSLELIGTIPSEFSSKLFGIHMIKITNKIYGSTGIFALCKNNRANVGTVIKLTSSNPSSLEKLKCLWNSNVSATVEKTSILYDGIYTITTTEPFYKLYIALSGTSSTILPYFLANYTGYIMIENTMINAPCALFSVSKVLGETVSNVITVISARGMTTHEKLQLVFSDTSIAVSKNGINYDGIYRVSFVR